MAVIMLFNSSSVKGSVSLIFSSGMNLGKTDSNKKWSIVVAEQESLFLNRDSKCDFHYFVSESPEGM